MDDSHQASENGFELPNIDYRKGLVKKLLTPTKLDSNKNQETYDTSLSDHTTGIRLKTYLKLKVLFGVFIS